MKKTLRGKRYLHSRSSVGVSRAKRFERNFNRSFDYLFQIDWRIVAENLTKEIRDEVEKANLLRENIRNGNVIK